MSDKKRSIHPTVEERGDVDIEELIEKTGCAQVYAALEECLGENDRDWRKCQPAVKALKLCHDKQQQHHTTAPKR